jgi:hypothetical protein
MSPAAAALTLTGQTVGVTHAGSFSVSPTVATLTLTGQTVGVSNSGGGGGDTINAASASRADVLTAIASASPGDTVVVPASAGVSWSGDISISGITLIGQGKDAGSPTVITAGTVDIAKHSTHETRLSGFRFTGTGLHATSSGTRTQEMFFIDDCYFNIGSSSALVLTNGGVFYGNDVFAATPTGADVFQTLGPDAHDEWTYADTLGTNDTNGDINLYIEDNAFTNVTETAPDGDNGSRLVIRYNTYTDSSIVFHSTSPNDSGDYGGTRHFEIYNNTFVRDDPDTPMNKWVWVRGASGVIRDNVWDEVSSSEYPGKPEIRFTVGCPTSYPIQYQVGQTTSTPTGPPDKPVAIVNNTGPLNISVEGGPIVTCGGATSYVQSGRDYVTTQTWSYTKYTYPHPARPT